MAALGWAALPWSIRRVMRRSCTRYQVFEDPPVHPAVGLRLNDMGGWEVVGQVVPLSTGSDHPTQGVEHFAQVVLALGSL